MKVIQKTKVNYNNTHSTNTAASKASPTEDASTSDDNAARSDDLVEEVTLDEQTTEEIEQSPPPESEMSAGFALDGALAEAASASLLITEARTADKFGFAQEGEEGSSIFSNPLVLGGLVGLTGIAIWAFSDGKANQPPEADADRSVTTNEDENASISISASDPDGDELTYAVTTAPTNGTTQVSGNTITYKPNTNFNGSDSLTVTITDSKGNTTTQAIAITVSPVNDSPKFDPGMTTKDIIQGQVLTGDVSGTAEDVEDDPLTFAVGEAPAHGDLVVNADGTFEYTSDLDFVGADSFKIEADDGNGGVGLVTYIVDVGPLPGPPTGQPLREITVSEDSMVDFFSSIDDLDLNSGLNIAVSQQAFHGTVRDFGDGVFDYTPNENYNGLDSFQIKGTSNDGSFTEIVNVVVTPVNDAPTAPAEQDLTTQTETPIDIPLIVDDVDLVAALNVPVTERISPIVLADDMPSNGQMSVDGNRLIYTPNEGFVGTDTFAVTYTDLAGASAKTTVTVTVTSDPATSPPTGTPILEEQTAEDVGFQGKSDIMPALFTTDAVTYSITQQPVNGTVAINPATGDYEYIPTMDYFGGDGFKITGTNAQGSFEQQINMVITPVNDDPTVDAESTRSIMIPKNTAKVFTISGSDVDGDTLAVLNSGPVNGTLSDNGDDDPKTFLYTPDTDFTGDDDFDITFDDGAGGMVTYTVEVTVTGAEEVSINGALPSEPNDFFDAGTRDWTFNADLTLPVHIEITDMKTGDIIVFSNGSMSDIILRPTGGNPADVFIESMTDPLQHRIYLPNIFPDGPPDSYAFPDTFDAAGFNFFTFAPG